LLQVLLVGLTLGTMRTVVPALAESEFGVPMASFMLPTAFWRWIWRRQVRDEPCGRQAVNWIGRQRALLSGWALALSIPH